MCVPVPGHCTAAVSAAINAHELLCGRSKDETGRDILYKVL